MAKPKGIKRHIPRKPGAKVDYSPEQRDRYRSLEERIKKALLLPAPQEIPSDDPQRSLYFFPSDRASAGGYTVTVIEQPPKEPDPPVPAPPGEPLSQDLWGKSRMVFAGWARVWDTFDGLGNITSAGNRSAGTGLPPTIAATDTTVNDWRRRVDPLTADSPPYPRPVSSANLLNEVYAGDVEKYDVLGGAIANELLYAETIFSTPDAAGLSLNQLDAARIPYWVGRAVWYSTFFQRPVTDTFGTILRYDRWRFETYDMYLLRYVGAPGDVPPSVSFSDTSWLSLRSNSGLIWTRDTPLELTGRSFADIWITSPSPTTAARLQPGNDGVDPVPPDEPYDPNSPITPEDARSEDVPDPSEPDQPTDPDLPIDPERGHYSCNCPDYSRIEPLDTRSPFDSRHRDRVWADSDAGAPVYYVGDREVIYCKHTLKTMVVRGEPLP